MASFDDDFALALQLQEELYESEKDETQHKQINSNSNSQAQSQMSLVDPYWEMTDPNPDVRALFLSFNKEFFWGRLAGIEVRWSPRMTVCAGLCCYEGRGGLCSVRLSVPLLKLRPRKDLVETLLHEMIHAYLFVTENNKDHDGHGPEFHKHMYRINKAAGTSISVYHNFHDEVALYKQHWWRCDGPCRERKPYYGYVKRSMNRAPSKNDTWWAEHQRTCGGMFTKVKEPEDYGKKKGKKNSENNSEGKKEKDKDSVRSMDIRVFAGQGKVLNGSAGTASSKNKPGPSGTQSNHTNNSLFSKKAGSVTIMGKTEYDSGQDNRFVSHDKSTDENKRSVIRNHNKETSGSYPATDTTSKRSRAKDQAGSTKFENTNQTKPRLPPSQDPSQDLDSGWKFIPDSQRLKKRKFIPTDFSDSDSDAEIPVHEVGREKCVEINTSVRESVTTSETAAHPIENCSKEINNSSDTRETKSEEVGDVRAMLRKVWGEKKFVGSNLSALDTKAHSAFGDNSNLNPASRKRPLSNGNSIGNPGKIRKDTSGFKKQSGSESVENTSKMKVKRNKSLVIYDNDNSKANPSTSSSETVTSPIEKLFKKMKDKQVSRDSGGKVDNSVSAQQEMSECPVCCRQIPASTINQHLDECLTLQIL